MLAAGKLDRKITLQRKTVTRSDSGEPSEAWNTHAVVWAHKLPMTGREFYAAAGAQIASEETARWRIRWLAGLTVQDRILEGAKVWEIRNVAELSRREGIEITAQAIAQS